MSLSPTNQPTHEQLPLFPDIDASDGFVELFRHLGHEVVVCGYATDKSDDTDPYDGYQNVAIECETCMQVLLDADRDAT